MQIRKNWVSAWIIAAGIVLVLYPFISNCLYNRAARSEIVTYEATADDASGKQIAEMFAAARSYNEQVTAFRAAITDPFLESDEDTEVDDYYDIFNMDDSGIMCFIEIPKISVCLPVYHGTSADTLEKGAGHIQGTAFPTGDVGIRPVISAHTGLNKAKMFSDLTELEDGDLFFLYVLGETFAYEVCDIEVVLPEDISALSAEKGRDLVTLITCTPYGVNTHRLIVTGERTAYEEGMEESIETVSNSTQWMEAYRRALLIGAVLAGGIVILKRAIAIKREKKDTRADSI